MHLKTQYNVIRDCIHPFTPTFASSAFLRDPYNQKTTLFITFVLQRQCVYNIPVQSIGKKTSLPETHMDRKNFFNVVCRKFVGSIWIIHVFNSHNAAQICYARPPLPSK